MSRLVIFLCLIPLLSAADKRSPQGQVEDETVSITATILGPEQIKQAVGGDFSKDYTVLDVRVTPKGGKPYLIHLDDFILRSESSGEHSGPFVAAQIAGAGALELEQTYANRSSPDSPRILQGSKVQMKDEDKANPALEVLKTKMMREKTVSEPESGLMFFPLTKEKAKNLILSCKTPQSKLRLSFKQ